MTFGNQSTPLLNLMIHTLYDSMFLLWPNQISKTRFLFEYLYIMRLVAHIYHFKHNLRVRIHIEEIRSVTLTAYWWLVNGSWFSDSLFDLANLWLISSSTVARLLQHFGHVITIIRIEAVKFGCEFEMQHGLGHTSKAQPFSIWSLIALDTSGSATWLCVSNL